MQKKPTKYFTEDGTPVKQKCIEEGIGYQSVLKYINKGLSPDEALERAKITKNDPWIYLGKLRYGDKSLNRYCKEKNLSYSKIYYRIYAKRMSVEESINSIRKNVDSF